MPKLILSVVLLLLFALPASAFGATVFNGDFETGNYSQWTAVQEVSPDPIQVVQSPVRQGVYASRFEVRNGDLLYGGARAEILWGDNLRPTLHEGDDYYFGWSTYWPSDFPSPSPSQGHSIFLQWKGIGTGSPPMEMSNRNERIALRTNNTDVWWVPLTREVWHDFVAHVKFSADPNVGYVEIWHDGAYQGHYPMATLISGKDSYLKVGYYRASGIVPTGVLYEDDVKVGTTYDDVAPGGAPPPPPPADSDGDGVVDSADSCPTVAGTNTDGCPSPVASYTYSPTNPRAGIDTVTFDGSSSSCEATPCTYTWEDDGPDGPGGTQYPLGTGVTHDRVFQNPGSKYVRLTVKDGAGRTSTVVQTVTVS
jgi:hypothetical protein